MTVQNETNREDYTGDGVQTKFPVSFYFLADDHLQVINVDTNNAETTWILNNDYTVNGAGNPAGGSIDAAVALPAGERLVILRKVPQTQLLDYVENDRFPADSHEMGLDKLTMIIQEMQEVLNRTYQETPGGQPSEEFLPSGTRVIIYNDEPPLGWSLVDVGDAVIGISNGTDKLYQGFPGGGNPGDAGYFGEWVVRVSGPVTVDDHVLTLAEMPSHSHAVNRGTTVGVGSNCTGAVTFAAADVASQPAGGNQGHNHTASIDENITFYPRAVVCMVIERD